MYHFDLLDYITNNIECRLRFLLYGVAIIATPAFLTLTSMSRFNLYFFIRNNFIVELEMAGGAQARGAGQDMVGSGPKISGPWAETCLIGP